MTEGGQAARLPLFVLIALAGCEGEAPLVPPEIALAPEGGDGSEISLIEGAQGGFHVLFALRARGLRAGSALVEWSVRPAGTGDPPLLRGDVRSFLSEVDAEGWLRAPAAVPCVLCPSPAPVSEVPLEFQFAVHDRDGTMGERTLALSPRCPDAAAAHARCEALCGRRQNSNSATTPTPLPVP
ncbi:MAG TPA: hypothetical protein VKN99_23065 [Polyangia bacterium]|nr:hypothetical protein [Polyangia bacterium]